MTEHFMIDAADPEIKLYVRNKRPEEMKQFKSEKTLLFVHGATQPAEATFDLSSKDCRGWTTSPARLGRVFGGRARLWTIDAPAGDGPAGLEQSPDCHDRRGR